MRNLVMGTMLLLVGVALADEAPRAPVSQKAVAPQSIKSPAATSSKVEQPLLVVHKSESCGCCVAWVRHMEVAGFRVEVHNEPKMDALKRALGIPTHLESCHTAKIDRYYIEGHVPAEDVKRLLAERPTAMGLAVPKMPIGSPGMEQGNVHEPYDVLLVQRNGKTSVFAHHGD